MYKLIQTVPKKRRGGVTISHSSDSRAGPATRLPKSSTPLTGLDLVGNVQRLVDVLGKDGRGQTKLGIVGSLERLFGRLEFDEHDDGSENLFVSDLHLFTDVSKDGRLDKESLVSEPVPPGQQVGAVVFTRFDVTHDPVVLDLTDLGSLEGIGLEGITDLEGLDVLQESLRELVVNALLNENPAREAYRAGSCQPQRDLVKPTS